VITNTTVWRRRRVAARAGSAENARIAK